MSLVVSASAADLFPPTTWANNRLIDFGARLSRTQLSADAPAAYGSIEKTLAHVVASEAYYVFALSGAWLEPPFDEEAGVTLADLQRRVRQTGNALVEIAGQVEPDATLRLSRRGELRSLPAGAVLAQALQHATTHREQVMAILSTLGVRPPDLSGWAFGGDASSDYK